MTDFDLYFLVYMAIISLISIILVILDKSKAKNHRYRIPEAVLFLFAALGGSAVMYLTLCLVRHKTQKNHFVFGIPFIFFLQCVCVYVIFTH